MTTTPPVPRTRTIVTPELLIPAFARAFEKCFGFAPEVIDCAIVAAKMINECGWPDAKDKSGKPAQACWNLNIGNIRGRSRQGKYTLLTGAYEFMPIGKPLPAGARMIDPPPGAIVPPGTYCYLPDPSKQEFRSYDNIDEACEEYVEVLGKHFKNTTRVLLDPNTTPEDFVRAMKTDRYFTGDETTYIRNVASVSKRLIGLAEKLLARSAVTPEIPAPLEMLSHFEGAATLIRAEPGEHTLSPMEEPVFDDRPWYKRMLGLK